jgi:hypothetical protein
VELPFVLRGVPGAVHVSLTENTDPPALGCDLLDPSLPPDAARGFAVCRATVELATEGYAAALGWIQLVRSSDGGDDLWAPDPLALFREIATPFAFFGIKPELFDAPFRGTRDDLRWTARSFLCAVPDGVMSRAVAPVVGFGWGFSLSSGTLDLDEPQPLPGSAWDDHVPLLRDAYPTWSFQDRGGATSI